VFTFKRVYSVYERLHSVNLNDIAKKSGAAMAKFDFKNQPKQLLAKRETFCDLIQN